MTTFDLFNLPAAYYEDPAPWFAQLRAEDPIHRNADDSVLLTRYRDVRTVWRDATGVVDKSEDFSARFGPGALLEHHTTTMLFRDPPDHDRLRAIVNPFFSQSAIAALREWVTRRVDDLLDEAQERQELDFVRDVAFQLTISVICRILGLPVEDGEHLHNLGAQILYPLNPRVSPDAVAQGHRAAEEFLGYLRERVDWVRANGDGGSDSVIAMLVAAERAGREISEAEMLHMCILILNGGHETTTNLIAVSLHNLLSAPDQLALLREPGSDIGATAIEECIRFVSPLQLQGRRTTRVVTLPDGTDLAPGTEVVLCQASANRDEDAFPDPDRLDLRRRTNAHVAFGLGIHVCIGRPLARLEAGIALPRVVQRFRQIERTGIPRFNRNARFRGLEALPVALRA